LRAYNAENASKAETPIEQLRLALWFISKFTDLVEAERAFNAAVVATKEMQRA
jgi:hypothetical protein